MLGQHHGQHREAGGVVGQAQEGIAGPNQQLCRQHPVRHIELVQQVAGRERHASRAHVVLGTEALIRQELHIPAVKQDTPAVRVVAEAVDHIVDLVDTAAVPGGPGGPLGAVDRAQVALLGRPFVPDRHPVFLEPAGIGVAAQEPDELIDNALKVQFLGSEQGKAIRQAVAVLAAENRQGSGAGAVTLYGAVIENVLQQIQILLHFLPLLAAAREAGPR